MQQIARESEEDRHPEVAAPHEMAHQAGAIDGAAEEGSVGEHDEAGRDRPQAVEGGVVDGQCTRLPAAGFHAGSIGGERASSSRVRAGRAQRRRVCALPSTRW
ncbi:hypothetical protein GCM10009811_11090 [Nostocoides veronense]|uniref:Uncharacterized protein n=1 Tax=Nostocoides veronense TaxID=330836 RepID=A0ABP4XM08_9MICO